MSSLILSKPKLVKKRQKKKRKKKMKKFIKRVFFSVTGAVLDVSTFTILVNIGKETCAC